MTPGSRAVQDGRIHGIFLFCIGLAVMATMNAVAKHLVAEFPVPQIIWARYFFHCALMLALFPQRIPTFLVSSRKGLQVLRGLLMLTGTLCIYAALQFLPLAELTAITFTMPLVATVLSVVILREHVGPRRWAAVALGFVGVLIIVRPGSGVFQWPALLPILFACLSALYQITTRMARAAADPLNALFYTAVVGAVLTLPFVLLDWRTPDSLVDWVALAALGALGGSGHLLFIQAFRRAPVSVIAPFGYTELFWAALLGAVVFGDLPDLWTWCGAGVIAASGLYVLQRERAGQAEGNDGGGRSLP